MNFNSKKETADKKERQGADEATKLQDEQVNASEENSVSDNVTDEGPEQKELEELKKKYDELNDSHLRLMAEFDNYRKRTLKERMELTKNAGEQILEKILPVMDNFERALKSMETAEDVPALREGVELIYANFRDFLSQQGVKEMECLHTDFDPELQEAVTKIPAPAEELKGKVVDCIQKGYTLHDKVIRFPKVVVGE